MSARAELTKIFGCEPPWIAGVLNITPDSFSDGGVHLSTDDAVAHGLKLVEDGAHIIDIGGEATGPGSAAIDAAEELRRIEPVVTALSKHAFVSVDTYKSETAVRCLAAGARMINDVSGMRADPEMANVVREYGAFLVLMYSKQSGSTPHIDEAEKSYIDIANHIGEFLCELAAHAARSGVPHEKIILDPGMGRYLSNRPEDSWDLLARMDEIVKLTEPYPIFVGTSRKGFLGGKLSERDPISQLSAVFAVQKGASIIRTHNAAMAKQFLDALRRVGE